MSLIPRIYFPAATDLNATYTLDEDSAAHLLRVLRLGENASIKVFNGMGKEFAAVLKNVQKKSADFMVQSCTRDESEPELKLHLGQVISKGDRMDFTIQKATELGVAEITPLFSERCEVRLNNERMDKKIEHWQAVAVSACQQSGRTYVPVIHEPVHFSQWCNTVQADLRLVLHPHQQQPLTKLATPKNIALLIGPEGGFSELEITQAMQQSFTGLQLGPRILRTETAALAALSVLQYQWGDLGS